MERINCKGVYNLFVSLINLK